MDYIMNAEKKSGKKGFVIAALVLVTIIVAVGAFWLYDTHQRKMANYLDIADTLLDRNNLSTQRDHMLAGEGWRGAAYPEAKDQPAFRKILAEQFQLMLDEETGTVRLSKTIALLDQQGIQDETIRAAYQSFMTGKRQELTPDAKSYTISAFFEGLQAVSSSFYSDGIMSQEDAAQFLREQVDSTLAAQDFEGLAKTLGTLAEIGYLELCYPEPEELVDALLGQCEVYTVAKGRGGYYDDMEDGSSSHSVGLDPAGMGSSIGTYSSSSSDRYYGDFHSQSYSSTTHYDGLVDQASKDKYNSSNSGGNLSFRDMDIDGYGGFQWAAESGARFAICGRSDTSDPDESGLTCVALFDGRQLYIEGKWNNGSMECYTVEGDFQSQLQQAEAAYQEKYSILAWYDNATNKLAQGDLDGAMELFQLYPAFQEAQDGLMQIAVAYLEAEDYQKGIDVLGLTYEYKTLKGKTVADVVKMLAEYDPEYSRIMDFAPSFCRLLASTLTPLTGEEIRAGFPGVWTALPNETWRIGADGTWVEPGFSGRFTGTWTTEGDILVRFAERTGKRAEFQVYDILGAYYYVAYTDSSWHAYLLQRKS